MAAELKDLEVSSPQPKSVREAVRSTTIVESTRLSKHLDVELTLASETFQHTGSFKFRAAYNLAAKVSQREIIAASSGNFGQALAYACELLGKSCTVVMPKNSAQVKIDAVRSYGATVDLVDVNSKSRAERLSELAKERPKACFTNAYDDPLIIQGNATLAEELCARNREFDCVGVPIGGGGLSSGLVSGFRRAGKEIKVFGAEPLLANDAAQSLRLGYIVKHESEPQTIADGARTVSLGQLNWEILRDGLAGIVEVPEDQIKEGVRLLFNLANLKVEPTGALAIGALLADPERFRGQRVSCVISGGNVDAKVYGDIVNSSGLQSHSGTSI